jgi:ATP-binding cassette subfamily B protein
VGSFTKLNRYFKKYKGTILLGSLFLIAANFFLAQIPVFLRRAVDEIKNYKGAVAHLPQGLFNIVTDPHTGWLLAKNALLLIGAALLYGILFFATRETLIVGSRKIEYDLRNDILSKLLKLPARFYDAFNLGEIYVRATEDVTKTRQYFGPAYMYTINTLSRASFVIFMMFTVSPRLALWALAPLPVLVAFAYWVGKYINDYSRIIQEQYSTLSGQAQETFSSIRLIKAFNREAYEQQQFKDESRSYRKKRLRLDMLESFFHPTLNFLIGSSIIIVIWKAGQLVIAGTLTVGNIVEFVVYVAYLTWPVASLGYTINRFQEAMASWKRIDRVLTEEVHIADTKQGKGSRKPIRGRITFDHVSFKYPGSDAYALKNINLTIEEGQNAAVVGRTGSGKTTLVRLLPRLYEATEGAVKIDGIDIRDISLSALRRDIGMVPQDTFLFSGSVGDNIAFGAQDASQEEIERAAEKAQVRDNILQFENKFETMLGERGITLSGGQKQRTAIARALLKEPKIIVLDDSLSAVDTKTEEAILQHLRDELKGRTTIMISHRISTIKESDIIFFMEDGTIKERGTHNELLRKKGRYYNMYSKQLIEKELAEI